MRVTDSEWAAMGPRRTAAAGGDETAWQMLFETLWVWTVHLARSEDGAMGAWIKLLERPQLWLMPVPYFAETIRNCGLDVTRRGRLHERRVAALRPEHLCPGSLGNNFELAAVMRGALSTFLPIDRQLLDLSARGFKIAEAAALCGLSYATAWRRLERMRSVLRRAAYGRETRRGEIVRRAE